MKILVIIPAYNEEKNIGQVISSVKKELPSLDILVVNDGSMDHTGSKAGALEVSVVDLPHNLGIGGAMQTGYLYAYRNGYDIAVQVDGDGQHPADQIMKLIHVVSDGKVDMAIGSRFMGEGEYKPSKTRKVGMVLFSSLLSLLVGQRVTDTTSGFRAVNRRAIQFFSRHYPEDYPEVEALMLLHRQGFKFVEVPIKMQGRLEGKSSITPFRSLYYMVKVTLSLLVEMLRREIR